MKSKNKKMVRKVLSSFKFYEEALDTGKIISVKDEVVKSSINNHKLDVNSSTGKINKFTNFVLMQTKRILSQIKVQEAVCIGFMICQEEIRRSKSFNSFWKEVSISLAQVGNKWSSRSSLFEAKRLYEKFKRFANVRNGSLTLENVQIPPALTKSHLALIARHCKTDEQQDLFIKKVQRFSMSAQQLSSELKLGVSKKAPSL